MRHRLAHLQILVYGQFARGHRHDGKSGSRAGMHAKGVDSGLVDASIMPFVLILIIVSSLLTPLLLKLTYKHDKTNDTPLNPPLTDGGTEQSDVATEQSDSTQASDILSQAHLPKTND